MPLRIGLRAAMGGVLRGAIPLIACILKDLDMAEGRASHLRAVRAFLWHEYGIGLSGSGLLSSTVPNQSSFIGLDFSFQALSSTAFSNTITIEALAD